MYYSRTSIIPWYHIFTIGQAVWDMQTEAHRNLCIATMNSHLKHSFVRLLVICCTFQITARQYLRCKQQSWMLSNAIFNMEARCNYATNLLPVTKLLALLMQDFTRTVRSQLMIRFLAEIKGSSQGLWLARIIPSQPFIDPTVCVSIFVVRLSVHRSLVSAEESFRVPYLPSHTVGWCCFALRRSRASAVLCSSVLAGSVVCFCNFAIWFSSKSRLANRTWTSCLELSTVLASSFLRALSLSLSLSFSRSLDTD